MSKKSRLFSLLVSASLFLCLPQTAVLGENLDTLPNEAKSSENDEPLSIVAVPTIKNLSFKVGLHLWNTFQVKIKNQSKKPIKISSQKFILLDSGSGNQFNSLDLDTVYVDIPNIAPGAASFLVPKINLDPIQRQLISKEYMKDGLLLPKAIKEGLIFFSKKEFSFNADGNNYKLYYVLSDEELVEVKFVPEGEYTLDEIFQ